MSRMGDYWIGVAEALISPEDDECAWEAIVGAVTGGDVPIDYTTATAILAGDAAAVAATRERLRVHLCSGVEEVASANA